jgi:hypothetical protein
MPMTSKRRCTSISALAGIVVVCGCLILAAYEVRSRGGAVPSTAAPSWEQSVRLIGNRFAACLRGHGHPQIADPMIRSDGRLTFGAQDDAVDAASRALRGTTCRRELLALKDAPPKPPTTEELRRAVRFSECIRKHGVPDWPDPNPDGTYPLDARLRGAGKGGIVAGLEACRRLNPSGGIRLSPGPAAPQ